MKMKYPPSQSMITNKRPANSLILRVHVGFRAIAARFVPRL